MTEDETTRELARLRRMERDLESGALALPTDTRRTLLYQVRLQIGDIQLATTLNRVGGVGGRIVAAQ